MMTRNLGLQHPWPLLRLAAAAAWLTAACVLPAAGQTAMPAPAAAPLDAASFVRLAHSSAVLQARAAQLVASREARPEARQFAQTMVAFRKEQMPRLEAFAREHQLPVPTAQIFEHQVVLENLEPLDFLALSRRYAEIQVQALEQEVRGYASADGSPDARLKTLAAETRPRLEQLLTEARQMRQVVGP
jgi:putative membrane protein